MNSASDKKVKYLWACGLCTTGAACASADCSQTSLGYWKELPTVELPAAEPAITVSAHVSVKGQSVIGWIHNTSNATATGHHVIFGKIALDKSQINGVFIGDGANNNGVWIAKAHPIDPENSNHAQPKVWFRLRLSDGKFKGTLVSDAADTLG